MINLVVTLVLVFCIFYFIKARLLKPSPSDTPAGAIVMACGIFINGAMKNIPLLDKGAGRISAAMLLLLWIFIAASFINTYIQKSFKERHLKNPIKSFAIGTWVAGTSVCGIAVFQRLPELSILPKAMFFLNILLWLFYATVLIRSYKTIYKNNLLNKVHGVVLLATVSTQSLVVLGCTVFGERFPSLLSQGLISLGIVFYIVGFIFIIKRYFFDSSWNVEEDWQNTNCILHGAMSITGLASVVSKAVNYSLVLLIWIWILLWLLIVEGIEVYRAFKRIKKYGFAGGLAVYDITQWARIFTFGMFYTFTMRLNLKLSALSNHFMFNVQGIVLTYGTWVMVFILILEGLLFFSCNRRNKVI